MSGQRIIKRYSLAFKQKVVSEIESGKLTVSGIHKKFKLLKGSRVIGLRKKKKKRKKQYKVYKEFPWFAFQLLREKENKFNILPGILWTKFPTTML